MWKKILMLVVTSSLLFACKEQPPKVLENPVQPSEPSIHIIDNYYYLQYTEGKQQDTHTYEVLDDTTAWTDSTYVNFVYDTRVVPIYDTTDADELEEIDDRMKIGFTYAPTTTIAKNLYYKIQYPDEDFDFPDLDEIDEVDDDYFSIQFPFSTYKDTLAFWDIEDYLDNPSLKETGLVRWGRVGNDDVNDTIWNNDAREGVVLSYVDTAGTEWRSDNWPTFQPYGYFKLLAIEANYRDGQSYDIITGEFAVRLYDDGQAIKDMRFGRFRLRILADIELGPEPE